MRFLYFENDPRLIAEIGKMEGAVHASDLQAALAAINSGPFDFIISGSHDWSLDFSARFPNHPPIIIFAGNQIDFEEWETKIKGRSNISVQGNSSHHDEIAIGGIIKWAESVYCPRRGLHGLTSAILSQADKLQA